MEDSKTNLPRLEPKTVLRVESFSSAPLLPSVGRKGLLVPVLAGLANDSIKHKKTFLIALMAGAPLLYPGPR